MNQYRMYERADRRGTYYWEDVISGKQGSLKTKDHGDAQKLLHAKNETARQPHLNRELGRLYLKAADAAMATRTWQDGTELPSTALSPGWIDAEWVATNQRQLEIILKPATPIEKQWCAQQQRILLGIAEVLNREIGIIPSSDDFHRAEDVVTTMRSFVRTHSVYKP